MNKIAPEILKIYRIWNRACVSLEKWHKTMALYDENTILKRVIGQQKESYS